MAAFRRGRKTEKSPQSGSPYDQNEVTFTARRVRTLIRIIGSILFAIFAYLQLKDLQIGGIIESVSPDVLRRLILVLYYWCWIFGCTFDTNIQELAYYTEKGRFKLGATAIALVVLFGVVAGVLLWTANDDQKFAGALIFFFSCNVLGFLFILKFIRPIIEASEGRYRQGQNYFSLAQLDVVAGYMNGFWQWARFAVGLLVVAAMVAICFSDTVRLWMGTALGSFFSMSTESVATRLPTLTFVLFVGLMEGWIWIQRARVAVSLKLLEELSVKYRLVRLETAQQT